MTPNKFVISMPILAAENYSLLVLKTVTATKHSKIFIGDQPCKVGPKIWFP